MELRHGLLPSYGSYGDGYHNTHAVSPEMHTFGSAMFC